jgi:putative phage-type endonuclease
MFLSDLEDLEDILDLLEFEDEPTIFNEENTLELMETIFHLIDQFLIDNPHIISEPDFNEIVFDEISNLFHIQMEDFINCSDYVEDDLNDIIEDIFKIIIYSFNLDRSIEQSLNIFNSLIDDSISFIEQQISYLKNVPQPPQRTPEWYLFRWNLITASNAWKAFESCSVVNQLIYEKCQPLKSDENNNSVEAVKIVNTNTPLHWGQKYEPVSVLIYEFKFNTIVDDFGCIQHPTYKFIGASPDGINVDKTSDRYGRMLEIKNVVSREINGIPKKEYWIQMQLQMEVCNLNECDFLETKFTEYPSTQTFYEDSIINENDEKEICISKDNKTKGIIMSFHTKDGSPFYVYKPLNIISEKEIQIWEEEFLEKYESEQFNYIFIKFIYWKLDVFSCVFVKRNNDWFKNNIGQLEKVWNIIEIERISGFDHRAPNKKPKKEFLKPFVDTASSGCLLKFNKITKVDTNDK